MLTLMTIFLALAAHPANPVDSALANFRQLNSYQVTLMATAPR